MDRLKAMAVFVEVADAGGFAAAARNLRLSPASATRAVSGLETQLGVRLLYRTTRSLRLTEVGRRYLMDCRRILADLEEADRHAAGVHTAPSGNVTVSASVLFGRLVVAPILLDLLDFHPGISISGVFVDRPVHLVDEGVDIAIRLAELPDSSLSAVRVGSVRRVMCASPEYLTGHGRPKTPEDLNRHRIVDFVNMAPGGVWTFGKADEAQRVQVTSRYHVNDAETAIAAALSGRGMTRVLSYMVAQHVAGGSLEIVLGDHEPPVVPVHVLHKEAGQTSGRVRAAVDFLTKRLRQSEILN